MSGNAVLEPLEPATAKHSADDRAQAALDHGWRYFQLHAQQRIAVFNFFVVTSGVAFAGLATLVQARSPTSFLGVPLGLLMVVLSIVAWKLDQRGAALVKRAEQTMQEAEGSSLPGYARLFAIDARNGVPRGHWSFSSSFGALFLLVGLVGLGGIVWCGLRTFHLPLSIPGIGDLP